MYKQLMSPVFADLQARENYINNLDKKFETFTDWFLYISKHHQTMIELAKWYVRNNWESVDWCLFYITNGDTTYNNFVYKPVGNEIRDKLMSSMYNGYVKFNSVKFVYDDTDADLLIDIDGEWWFMNDEQVVDAAMYIEKKKK